MSGFGDNGVECGQANPIANLAAHFTKDVSLREIHQPTLAHAASRGDVLPPPSTFRMDSLLRELQGQVAVGVGPVPLAQIGPQQQISPTKAGEEWTKEFIGRQANAHTTATAWGNEYNPSALEPAWHMSRNELHGQHHHVMPMTNVATIPPSLYQAQGHGQTAQELLDDSKWVTDFRTPEQTHVPPDQDLRTTAKALLNSVTDPTLKATDFMSHVEKLAATQDDDQYDFQFQNQLPRPKLDVADEWAAEFTEDWNKQHGLYQDDELTGVDTTQLGQKDFWTNLQKEWDRLATEEGNSHPWLGATQSAQKKYEFNAWNPFGEALDPLSEGKRRLDEGDIPSAALAFEAAVQKQPENSEAWLLLGTTQAQNEQDPLAIEALKKCVELQPDNLTALMTLAACQTNESFQLQAAIALKKWLKVHPKYSHLIPAGEPDEVSSMPTVTTLLPRKDLDRIQGLFMKAARLNPTGGIDPDVQSGLGILFNLSGDYTKAAECFQAALGSQPQDSLLWNRLGATLANGGKSAEAVGAYRRALELSPGFIRTRYNLGISCVNLGAYKEAAEHFLSALNQQAAGKTATVAGAGGGVGSSLGANVMSDSIWSSMRMVLHLIDRSELAPAIDTRDLSRLNQEFNIVA